MIANLEENFLYERLPDALLDLDARGLIQAVVGGYQDRIDDLRSYSKKIALLFQTDGLPDKPDNVVLVDIQSDQGKVFTRSLDIQDDTPAGGDALTAWVLSQLVNVPAAQISNIRYGSDLLRFVDADTIGYLASTLGAVLFQSNALSVNDQARSKQQILQTYFPRLRTKGTADSFQVLGRILGFDDVKITPLYGRLSPRIPNDIGVPANDQDFSADPEYQPQQAIDDFYNPLKTNDGPFFFWSGTVAPGTGSTQFCTEVVNGFNPWVNVSVLSVEHGTVVYPAAGSYALGSSGPDSIGGPHKKAYVVPGNSGVQFEAVGEGQYFNGIEIHVMDSGTNKVLSIVDRLSAIKYRSSYFDLSITAEFDRAEELYGKSSMRQNKDLLHDPALTPDGTAVSPYRPWWSGSVTTGLTTQDFLTLTGTNAPSIVVARVQSSGTDRQLNTDLMVSAGIQVVQAFEEVRPATRQARHAGIGFLLRDTVGYSAFVKETLLFTTTSGSHYSGSSADAPLNPFYAVIAYQVGTGARGYAESVIDPANPDGYLFAAPGFTGSYNFSSDVYDFIFTSATSGTGVYAIWKPTSTEVIRTEPSNGTEKAYQARPEDQENGFADEVADDFPWRRDITLGGEVVDVTVYDPISPDVSLEPVDPVMAVPGHDGVGYDIFGINSTTGVIRLVTAARSIGADYQHGLPAVAYAGEIKDLSTVVDTPGQTDLERLFIPGTKLYMVGNVQGVLVADPDKFYSPAHRQDLIGWFPFNEHVDADLPPVDHAAPAANLSPVGLTPGSRKWDSVRGWYLQPDAGSVLTSSKARFVGSVFSLSFWFKPGVSTQLETVYSYGPLSITWNGSQLKAYWALIEGGSLLVGTATPSAGFTFICLSMAGVSVTFGSGDSSTPISTATTLGDFAGFELADTDFVLRGTDYGLSDLRMWFAAKSNADLDSIRDYAPLDTKVGYQVGSFLSLNRQDRYALKVLPCGLVYGAALPGWYRVPRLAFVTRYDSLGRFTGESRRKEVGLGGGLPLPASYVLGQQFCNLTADGVTVVSPQTGIEPGINPLWQSNGANSVYLRVIQTGSDSFDTFVSTGTNDPWPNKMAATNPGNDAVWVEGDDGYVYELSLVSSGTGARLVAEFIARERSDAELAISSFGTGQWPTLRFSEQPTGAQSVLTNSGKILAVAAGGSNVYQKAFSGTSNTPPLYLYLNSRTVVDVSDAYAVWTDPTAFGSSQSPPTAAAQADGELVFEINGAITPGNYRLTVVSGNIGKVDADFDGFAVDITIDATVLQERLCQGFTGYNFTGTDVFEFVVSNGVTGDFLATFDWTNAFSDSARGEARQLAIHSFRLDHLTTELYQVSIAASGTTPNVTKQNTSTYDGSVPGGWLEAINSYGSLSTFTHESLVYPGNDTLTSKYPLSETLTATTIERREDVLGPVGIVLANGTTATMPVFGSIVTT